MKNKKLLSIFLLSLLTACGYGVGSRARPKAERGRGTTMSAPQLSRDQREQLRLRKSGCSSPTEALFLIQFIVNVDGHTGPVRFTGKAQPSDCVRQFVERVVAGWHFDPPARMNGEPVSTYSNMTVTY